MRALNRSLIVSITVLMETTGWTTQPLRGHTRVRGSDNDRQLRRLQDDDDCPRTGPHPGGGCESWTNVTCLYGADVTPQWALDDAVRIAREEAIPVCSDRRTTNCVNTTSSARTFAAVACLDTWSNGTEGLLMSEYARLPAHQYRAGIDGLELNVIANEASNVTSNRELQVPACSSFITHTCTRLSTGYIFDSKFTAQSGTGATYTQDWQQSPRTVLYLQLNELLRWDATCSKSSLSVTKRHTFRAGGNTVTKDETTSGRSKRSVFLRCVTLTTYIIN